MTEGHRNWMKENNGILLSIDSGFIYSVIRIRAGVAIFRKRKHMSNCRKYIIFCGLRIFVMSVKIVPSDILCEFIEVVIHNILFARKLYPSSIFSRRRKYGIAVYQCIQPDVNNYINEVLKALTFHAKKNQLKRIFICFHSKGYVTEKYVIDIIDIKNAVEGDPLLIDLEQYMRDFILRLHSTINYLDDLGEDSTFSIRLQVSAYSGLEFNQDPHYEVRKKNRPLIKLSEERLSLQCNWSDCNATYDSWQKFNSHVIEHATNQSDNIVCEWQKCKNDDLKTIPYLMQHLSHHAYITKLKNIGENICGRTKLPACSQTENCLIPIIPNGYTCEWEYCSFNLLTIYEFLNHMNVHVKNNPNVASDKEVITCCWNYCNTKYSTQTKLAEHVRTHTKEKTIGCPSCGKLFSNKTKFCDHRKRQLSSELQSYQCSQCLKLFPSERLLRDHMRSHVNHYKCTMCDMTCPKPSILAKHIRFKHINFKPYKCPRCDKTFVEKHNLNTHLKTHEQKNPLKCDVCDFECRSSVGLENHYVKKHDAVGLVYECHCCKKKFKRGTFLTRHLTKQHNYHWPSGHSRFRYRKDQDGICRLQTVRYESLEVTQEMIRGESMQANALKQSATYNLKYDNDGKSGYVLSISEDGEQSVRHTEKMNDDNILITINDVDDQGNILKCEVQESTILPADEFDNKSMVEKIIPYEECNGKRKEIQTNDDDDDDDDDDGASGILEEKNKLCWIKEENDNTKSTILDYEMFKNN